MGWLVETWKFIQEDWVRDWKMFMTMMPLARTPMDKKGSQALQKYQKGVEKNLNHIVYWKKGRQRDSLRERYKGRINPGEVVAVLGAGESSNHPLFKGTKIIRE